MCFVYVFVRERTPGTLSLRADLEDLEGTLTAGSAPCYGP